uniref:Uncharacterized protein n=1 Tax=Solibacter usitatus (strain Ellin6076) TaxID=234267 RepID=Q01W57_SOLUE
MKRTAMNITLAVAALAVAVGTVSAQTMKAEIPFAFRVGNRIMQPGEYRISLTNGATPILRLANFERHQAVLLSTAYMNDVPKQWAAAGLPKLSFLCGEGPCTVSQVWTGEGYALSFGTPRGKNGEPHIAEIVLRRDRAD